MTPHEERTYHGTKFDDDKNRIDLWSPYAIEETAKVLTYGANKYADHNWMKGMNYHRVYRAALGHLLAFWRGEEADEESGISHLAHAMCCVMFLLHYETTGQFEEYDNRPPQRIYNEEAPSG